MTIEIKITTTNEHIPSWIRSIANFLEGMTPKNRTRTITVKIEGDC